MGTLHFALLLPEQLALGVDYLTLVSGRVSAAIDSAEQVKHAWGCWFQHDNTSRFGAVILVEADSKYAITAASALARRD